MSPVRCVFDRAAAVATMAADARAFYRFGWMLGTSGNLSIRRDEESFLITASGKDKGRLSGDDFLVCDLAGHPVEPTERRPSAETLVHCAIYERLPDVGAIYHVHEPYSALCSARDRRHGATRFSGVEMIKGLDIWDVDEVEVPIVPNHPDIPRLAESVAETVARTSADSSIAPAVTIHNHGYYAWGASPFDTKRHVETLAYLYRYSWELADRFAAGSEDGD